MTGTTISQVTLVVCTYVHVCVCVRVCGKVGFLKQTNKKTNPMQNEFQSYKLKQHLNSYLRQREKLNP